MITADFSTARWRKSSYSTNAGNCVEVAVAGGAVGLRDSKHPHGTPLAFPTAAFTALVTTVR